MKIAYKLAFVVLVPLIAIWGVVLYASSSGEARLSLTIERAAVSQAYSVMEEVERIMHLRIANWKAYGQSTEVQDALRESNYEFAQIADVEKYIDKIDAAWRATPFGATTPLFTKVSENAPAKAMRARLEILNSSSKFPVYGEVFITNRYGANVAQTGRTSDFRQNDEEWWQRAEQDGVYVAEVSFDESAGVYSTDICLRIDDRDGEFIGVLKAVLNIREVINIIEAQTERSDDNEKRGADYNYILFNTHRQIIYSADSSRQFLEDGSSYFDGIVPIVHERVFSAYREYSSGQDDEIHRHFITYAFSSPFTGTKGLQWCLVLEHDAETILRPVHELQRRILLIASGATLAVVVFGAIVAFSISRRLKILSEATIAFGQGDFARVVQIGGNDELTLLATQFNDMTRRLRAATDTLIDQAIGMEYKNAQLEEHIIERERVAVELRKERDFAETLIETAQVIVLVLDTDGCIVRFNHYMEELSGYRLEEVRGRNWFSTFVPESERDVILARFEKAVNDVRTRGKVNQIVAKDGRLYEIEWYDNPLRQSDGRIIGILAIGQDITERASLQSQLSHAQKLEAIGQLAAGIAHEINTPIQFVGDNIRFFRDTFEDLQRMMAKYDEMAESARKGTVSVELLEEVQAEADEIDLEYLLDETPKAVEQSLEGVERVAVIVRSMKEFSHPGGKTKEPTDLNQAIQTTVIVARNEWKYVAEMVMHLDDNLPAVPVFSGDFKQVVLNMIVNAAHAVQDTLGDRSDIKGTITLTTRPVDEDWVEFSISDTGAGMTPEVRERIFDPFFTTKEVGRGTGQGLAIAHNVIVKKHGGTIDVETELGRGTTFVIRLPLSFKASTDSVMSNSYSTAGDILST